MVPKGVFSKTQKIVKGTKTQLVIKVWQWYLLKTVPRSGFEQTWKNIEILIKRWEVFKGQKTLNLFACKHQTYFCKFMNKSKKRCQKGCQKHIVDSEHHRRTPRLGATSVKTMYDRRMGLTQSDSMRDTGRKLVTLAIPAKRSRNYVKMDADINKISSEWFPNQPKKIPKSYIYWQSCFPNLWKIEVASRMRFGSVLGTPWSDL